MIGLLLMTVGCVLFVPASSSGKVLASAAGAVIALPCISATAIGATVDQTTYARRSWLP
jgi:fucose permease